MIKRDKYIEIVRSNISALSSMSQKSCDAALAVLTKYYTSVRISVVDNLSDLEAIVVRSPDLVFLGMEFIPVNPALGLHDPNKIWLTSYLDEHGITYTGSGQTAHELGRNKPSAKQWVLDAGLKTAPFWVIKQNQSPADSTVPLAFPLFIKPTSRGGGFGIDSDSLVYNLEQLQSKVHAIASNLESDSLIEEYLPGREFSVAILKDEQSAEFSVMPIELIAPLDKKAARILSGEVKRSDTEQVVEVTDTVIRSKVTTLALDIFYALGARDYGRIDIRLDEQDVPHFLEVNLIPSLISGYGSFPKACLLNIGLDYEPMIIKITELALARAADNVEIELDGIALANAIPLVA